MHFKITALASVNNFSNEERKILGWAKYGLCFVDTALLIHFMSALGALIEAKQFYEHGSQEHVRLAIALSLATMYLAVFLSFFATYCLAIDHINLTRFRLAMLLSSGLANVIFVCIVCTLIFYYQGDSVIIDKLTFNSRNTADIAWITVFALSLTTVLMAIAAGFVSLLFNSRIHSLASTFELFNSYVNVSPVSPYSTFWKPTRGSSRSPAQRHSVLRDFYPHIGLNQNGPPLEFATPEHDAIIRELRTALPARNDQPQTVL